MSDKEWIDLLLKEIDDDVVINVYRHLNFKPLGGGREVADIGILTNVNGEKRMVTVPMDLPLTDDDIEHVSNVYVESIMQII